VSGSRNESTGQAACNSEGVLITQDDRPSAALLPPRPCSHFRTLLYYLHAAS